MSRYLRLIQLNVARPDSPHFPILKSNFDHHRKPLKKVHNVPLVLSPDALQPFACNETSSATAIATRRGLHHGELRSPTKNKNTQSSLQPRGSVRYHV